MVGYILLLDERDLRIDKGFPFWAKNTDARQNKSKVQSEAFNSYTQLFRACF